MTVYLLVQIPSNLIEISGTSSYWSITTPGTERGEFPPSP